MSAPLPAILRVAARKMRSAIFRLRRALGPDPDRHLKQARGVIHVGANIGQERDLYARLGLKVLWIEPIPAVFATLQANIAAHTGQRAVQALVSDQDGALVDFHVASNGGASSSMLDLKLHKELWPDVVYQQTITLPTITLPSLLDREGVDVALFDALVLDTQGAELKVLRGAESILRHFASIQIEVADFEAYEGCCQLKDIREHLLPRGYRESVLRTFGERPDGGRYYEMLYVREREAGRKHTPPPGD
jgi:FkbM family methyltransferase